MKKKQLHKPNRLITMLLIVMAILMPYGGGHGRKRLPGLPLVME